MQTARLSIIIPILNEVDNIRPLVSALEKALSTLSWEVIFVDDHSSDGTMNVVRALAQENPHVRGLCRIGRKGLSSAVIEGAMSSSSPFIAVMDGDLQHDETCLLPMMHALETEGYDLAVASRYVAGGKDSGLAHKGRRFLSQVGCWFIRLILKTPLSDPMSGFFVIRRKHIDQQVEKLSGKGFKILLDIILANPSPLRTKEVAMVFRPRQHGQSKLNWKIILSFGKMLLHHLWIKFPSKT
ncbi:MULTISPECIES: polyprenol monophosphomannose synthase [unclassified Saccharibacter]|uniref:polyprenol monophosphomannose synthase n=1 Tax=unclassified Saccharibacter TaxID=2648722 RepID=UPI001325BD90|nr:MULTISPECIES: polyprenol monophosphomannose synthase [unclassified Saccharibacter]MXV36940.1 glycosyltransferase [Saccharibacter sp. EH611]MXV58570.1 glycosyltransferase [Saccharibacter sp. EH70]MXV66076.1 glycosyltransferase [Saccharibacter sp. EH60]